MFRSHLWKSHLVLIKLYSSLTDTDKDTANMSIKNIVISIISSIFVQTVHVHSVSGEDKQQSLQLLKDSDFESHMIMEQTCTFYKLTKWKRGRDLVDVTVLRIKNKQLAVRQNLNRIWFDTEFASVEHCLHCIPILEFHHRSRCNCCFYQEKKKHNLGTKTTVKVKTLWSDKGEKNELVLVEVDLSDHNHFMSEEPWFEMNPLTISA